ncbi:11083_t:CDS:1, partial [Rhizophagus irregularis]
TSDESDVYVKRRSMSHVGTNFVGSVTGNSNALKAFFEAVVGGSY